MPKKPKDREDSESQLKSFSTNGNGDNVSQPSARSLTRSVKPAPPSAPKKHASAPASTTQREKQTAPLKRPEFASAGVWNDAKVRELWKRMSYETSFRDIQATYSDKKVAQALKKATEALDKAPIAETDTVNLLQHWVEMILRHAYKETREDQAQHTERYTEILYVCLNRRFLPEKYKSSDLAKRAGVAVNLADRFLVEFQHWIGQNVSGVPLHSLGWLIQLPDHSGLVVCWDELILRARYQPYWEKGFRAEILHRKGKRLRLWVYPREGDPYEVQYTVQGFEAEGLDKRDWVRYWENPDWEGMDGKPFLLPEEPLSPYAAIRRKEWDPIDENIYMLDPLPVG